MRIATSTGLVALLCCLPADTLAGPGDVAERRTVEAARAAVDWSEIERFQLKGDRVDRQQILELRRELMRHDVVVKFESSEYLLRYDPSAAPRLQLDDLRSHPVLTEILLANPEAGVVALAGGSGAARPKLKRPSEVLLIGGEDGVLPRVHPDTGTPMSGGTVGTGGTVGAGGTGSAGSTVGAGATGSTSAADEASARAAWNGYVRLSREDGSTSDNELELCTGILLSSRWVLTAGHCVRSTPAWVQVGGDADAWQSNQFAVESCVLHPKAFSPKTEPKTASIGTCDFGELEAQTGERGVEPRPVYDLALLRLATAVPEELAMPRTPLLSASDDGKRRLGNHPLAMFGYGVVQAPKSSTTLDLCRSEGLRMFLARTRQRMDAKLESDPLAFRMEIRAVPISPVGGELFGAVCGDSGGALTAVAGGAWPRELVIGVISEGNSPLGIAEVATTFQPANRQFLIDYIDRPIQRLSDGEAEIFGS